MWYAIISEDVDNSAPLRAKARPDHIKRAQQLVDEGRLLVGGPHPAIDSEEPGEAGFTGSLIIADFESLEDARAWAESDPYALAGLFAKVRIEEWKKVIG